MYSLAILLAACGAAACSSTGSRAPAPAPATPSAPTADTVRHERARVILTGAWATGSANEPAAKTIVLRPQCNYSPPLWVLDQRGDTVSAWTIPESYAQGVPSTRSVAKVAAEGSVSGLDVTMGTSGARYVLRYDSTSGHLRGTLNGAPFWAVRLDVVRPEGCIPPP